MTSEAQTHTEIHKLAQLLNLEAEQLEFLNKLNTEEVGLLREKVNEAIQNEQSPVWEKLARVTRFFPNRLNAKMAQEVLGPHIAANLTYHMPVKEAVNIAKHFSQDFLGEISVHLIPERAQDILNQFPLKLMEKSMRYLLEHEHYLTLGGYVDFLSRDNVLHLARLIQDKASILRIAWFSQRKDCLAEVVVGFDDQELLEILHKADELEMWEEILTIFRFINSGHHPRLKNLVIRLPQQKLENLKQMIRQMNLQEELNFLA